ncbi:general substrate transporter, partial [Lipomyces kononenkoae]
MVHFLNIYTISLFASIGGLLFGFEISSLSGIIETDQYRQYYGNPLGTRQGGITSAFPAGSAVGALLAALLGDWLSRKAIIQAGAVLWCVGSTLQVSSNGVGMLVVGRVLSGTCVGLTSAMVPIYQSEIAPRKIRGRIVSLQQLASTVGILVMYGIQFGCSFIPSQAAFRLPWAIQAIPGIILFIGFFWFPFSPRWLAKKERWDESLTVLAFLRTPDCDVNSPLVLAEYREIEDQIRLERESGSKLFKEISSQRTRRRVFLSIAVQVCNQLTGAAFLDYYILYIYQSVGIANVKPLAFIQYSIKVIMTFPAILWSDKWGRRPMLIIGAICIGICFFVVTGLYNEYGEPNPVLNQPYTWVIIGHPSVGHTVQAFLYLSIGVFNLTWGPITWIYSAEIVPLRIRARVVSFAISCRWAINCAIGFAIPALFRLEAWSAFLIFGILNVGSSVLMFFTAPETKQRTLEEIDEIFEHGRPLWMSLFAWEESNMLEMAAHDIEMAELTLRRCPT